MYQCVCVCVYYLCVQVSACDFTCSVVRMVFVRVHRTVWVGETGVGCHTGWLSHCQYLIRWMAVSCGDLHVTYAYQTEPHNVQTLAADRIIRLLQVHITFRLTFVIFVVIVAYDVAIVVFQICMNSPVHRIKQKISYQSDSVQQSVTKMA